MAEENTSVTDVPEMPTPAEAPAPETTSTPTGDHQVKQDVPVDTPASTDPDFSTLKIGDRKHFVLQDGLSEGQCRPFDIVSFADQAAGLVNGAVITDFNRDYSGAGRDGLWIDACGYDAEHKPGTWHDLH